MNIVIVGGGFGGVKAALEISKRKLGSVTLISDEPYFLHHASLYSTATGHSFAESVVPLTDMFANHADVKVVQDTMKSIDPDRKLVIGSKNYSYDVLIIAIGSVTAYFNINGVAKHAYGIKTLEEVREFNHHVKDEIMTQRHLDRHYVVIGAGPTGIELAGALKGYIKRLMTLSKMGDYQKLRVSIIEATDRILPRSSVTASQIVTKRLKKIGIEVLVNHKVEAMDRDFITVDGKKVSTKTAIWTSGLMNNPFFTQHQHYFKLSSNGHVEVNQYLEACPGIYVIGDNNNVKYSGMAWPAIHQGTFVAKHLGRKLRGHTLRPFHPHQPPIAVPVGENWGYVEWYGIYISGRIGYIVRRLMELYGYCMLLPLKKALMVWKSHDIAEIDPKLL